MKRAILLTGYNLFKVPRQLYYLIRMVRPDLTPNFYEYGYRYCDPRQSYSGINFDHSGNLDELKQILDKRVRIRQRRGAAFDEMSSTKIKFEVSMDLNLVVKIQNLIKTFIYPWEEHNDKSFFSEMFEN